MSACAQFAQKRTLFPPNHAIFALGNDTACLRTSCASLTWAKAGETAASRFSCWGAGGSGAAEKVTSLRIHRRPSPEWNTHAWLNVIRDNSAVIKVIYACTGGCTSQRFTGSLWMSDKSSGRNLLWSTWRLRTRSGEVIAMINR